MRGRLLVGAVLFGVMAGAQVGASHAAAAPEHGYVTNSFHLPTTNTEASALGRDVDGNGRRDNQFGKFLASMAGLGLDLTSAQSDAIATGEIVMLHSLRATTLGNTPNATWQVWYGAPTPDPDFTGTGSFSLPTDQPRSLQLSATIKDHRVSTAAGNIPLPLDIGFDPFLLRTKKAKFLASCTRGACSGGQLAGALTVQQVNNVLIPALLQWFQPVLQRDCPLGASSCMADSTGKTVQAIFDTNDDLLITTQEVKTSSPFLAPDLDLVKANGTPGKDGVKDAMSFGFGFTAVQATLVRP